MGPLLKHYGTGVLYGSGSSLNAKLSSMIYMGVWKWPAARTRCHMDLQSFLPNIIPTGGSDTALWLSKDSFKASLTWQRLREKVAKVPWHYFVWFKEAIPKHSFFTWIVVLNRLSTRDRQMGWNPLVDSKCVLWGGVESRDHLFFVCPFSFFSLDAVMERIGKACPSVWSQLLDLGIHALKKKTAINIVVQLALQACIYGIWRERNSRVHDSTAHSVAYVISSSLQTVYCRLAGFPGSNSLYT